MPPSSDPPVFNVDLRGDSPEAIAGLERMVGAVNGSVASRALSVDAPPAPLRRLDGWEPRLEAVIEAARHAPYVLGTHDCLRVACAAVEALTGFDPWPQWQGRYRTKREALVVIARYAGGGLAEAVTQFLGIAPVAPKLARRGDLLLYADPNGEHLGVCVGARAAVLGEAGLAFVRLGECRQAWRVG